MSFEKFYLKFLPYYSLIGIPLSISRSVVLVNLNIPFLVLGLILDIMIIGRNIKNISLDLNLRTLIFLLYGSLIIGVINSDSIPSRRIFTDISNPLFFFLKIYIFSKVWRNYDIRSYIKYYAKVGLVGSLILLPMTYFIFNSFGAQRLAIFPPMELPFGFYLVRSKLMAILCLLVILLYGKRTLLISALGGYIYSLRSLKKRKIVISVFIIFSGIYLYSIFLNNSESLALARLNRTIEQLYTVDPEELLEVIGGARYKEYEAITNEMDSLDYFIGKGVGFTYEYFHNNQYREVANAHFSPLGLTSKYGIFFAFFTYFIIFRITFRSYKNSKTRRILQITSCLLIIESFFAYSIFVMPIFPVVLGYLEQSR